MERADCEKIAVDTSSMFGVEVPWVVTRFSDGGDYVPVVDPSFRFVPSVVRAVLLGFTFNRRVYVHGPHGSGKTSHIEQVAARLNWNCVRVNLDGHITRSDLIGRDVITLRGGQQVTEFSPGILPWAVERPVALVLDEYDAGRPDVMFVIQRLLEVEGSLTLLDQSRVITPHPDFRLFATANTSGQGDSSGLYAGTQSLNQAQLDRWTVVCELGYMEEADELAVLVRRFPLIEEMTLKRMVQFAGLCRYAHRNDDLSLLVSLRTLLSWADNLQLLGDLREALSLSLINRCEPSERPLLEEFFQRCFNYELSGNGV